MWRRGGTDVESCPVASHGAAGDLTLLATRANIVGSQRGESRRLGTRGATGDLSITPLLDARLFPTCAVKVVQSDSVVMKEPVARPSLYRRPLAGQKGSVGGIEGP